MAAQAGLVVVKRFPYRSNTTEEFSNGYWFTGTVPASNAGWRSLLDALVLQEKTCYPATVEVIKAYGYGSDADDAASVYSIDLRNTPDVPVAGTLTTTGSQGTPGDAAALVRWKTARLSTKGKPVWLRKYFHGVRHDTSNFDNVVAAQQTALNAFATKLRDGSFFEARTLTARGHTDSLISSSVSPYVTTRTLKRRGKRPPTSP